MICRTTTPKKKSTNLAKTAVDIELFNDLHAWLKERVHVQHSKIALFQTMSKLYAHNYSGSNK